MFCILKIGCRCAFEIAKEAERDEIGLAGKQQFAGRARRMAAAGGSWGGGSRWRRAGGGSSRARHTKKIAMVVLHPNTIAKCVTSSKTVLLWHKTHFLTHLRPIFIRKCVKIGLNLTEFAIILVETLWKAWHTNNIAKCVNSSFAKDPFLDTFGLNFDEKMCPNLTKFKSVETHLTHLDD